MQKELIDRGMIENLMIENLMIENMMIENLMIENLMIENLMIENLMISRKNRTLQVKKLTSNVFDSSLIVDLPFPCKNNSQRLMSCENKRGRKAS